MSVKRPLTFADFGVRSFKLWRFAILTESNALDTVFVRYNQMEVRPTSYVVSVRWDGAEYYVSTNDENTIIEVGNAIKSNLARQNGIAATQQDKDFTKQLKELVDELDDVWELYEYIVIGQPTAVVHTTEQDPEPHFCIDFPVSVFLLGPKVQDLSFHSEFLC